MHGLVHAKPNMNAWMLDVKPNIISPGEKFYMSAGGHFKVRLQVLGLVYGDKSITFWGYSADFSMFVYVLFISCLRTLKKFVDLHRKVRRRTFAKVRRLAPKVRRLTPKKSVDLYPKVRRRTFAKVRRLAS